MLIVIFLVLALISALLYFYFAGTVIWKAALLFVGVFIALNLVYLLFWAVYSLFLSTKPLEKKNSFCHSGCVGILSLVLDYSWVRAHISGIEKLPEKENFLMVCNHRSGFDPLITLTRLHRYNIAFISKPSNMELPCVGKLAQGMGCLPIDRENDRNALKTILQAADYIKRGICSVGIYPEGTRSRNGQLLDFHAGSFKIAQKAKSPLVIACIRGSENITHNVLRRASDVYLDILEVVPAEKVCSMSTKDLAEYSREIIGQHLEAAV